MRFEDSWLLLLGLIIPLIVYRYIRRDGVGQLRFSSLKTLKRLPTSKSVYLRHSLIVLRSLCILLLVVAIARPQSGKKTSEIITEGVDIMLVLDTSGSMRALDFKEKGKRINRLGVVKNVVADFIKGRENDRLGMVVFAEQAFTQCPLTLDHGVVLSFLEKVEIGMAGDGTAIGSAIGTAVKRLKNIKAKSKIIILLTDGRNNMGRLTPEKAAQIARKYGVKIYTIGAGTKGKAPFLVNTFFGPRYVYKQVDLDEGALKQIADITGGQYFRATDTESLKSIYAQIDKMEKSEVKVKEYMEYDELFGWPLLGALNLLLLEIVLANTRFRRIP
jgi:Ca-activated chloride channel family protein